MVTIKLLDNNKISPERMASHAGKICYKSKMTAIEIEELLDVQKQLFKPGHHTTFEHQLFNFETDGISISDVTFGLHLLHPFYDSDQRSGRYSKMFDTPDFDEIREYIVFYYGDKCVDEIMDYIKYGYSLFANNKQDAIDEARILLNEERKDDQEYVSMVVEKMAQEQLRNVVSVAFDTGLLYSIDLITLVSMYEAPLNPVMKKITELMRDEVLKVFPEISYIFREEKREYDYESFALEDGDRVLHSPYSKIINISQKDGLVIPRIDDMMPVDKLKYKPKYANNNLIDISTIVRVSIATMGQDQRHRMIRRSNPKFTGDFYSPEIITRLSIKKEIKELMRMWKSFYGRIDGGLFQLIAPYGAMVEYKKSADINTFAHEQVKRDCWCPQEEIYNLNRLLREELLSDPQNADLIELLLPPCMKEGGRCFEGDRWCRRKKMDKNNPCPPRKI